MNKINEIKKCLPLIVKAIANRNSLKSTIPKKKKNNYFIVI